jgi:predicted RecB family nuclease
LRLWYDRYRRDLATPPDDTQQAIFDIGHEVGNLARQRWPGGTLVGGQPWEVEAAVEETRSLMADPSVPAIYEAAIVHRGVLTRVDVLVRTDDDRWDLVEVKSSTRVKETFETDVALQYWVLTSAGVPVRQAGILVLNRDYVYPGGPYDLNQLFRFEDRTCLSADRFTEIEADVEAFQAVLAEDQPPNIEIGEHCHSPYTCPYWAHCTRDKTLPQHPIDILPRFPVDRRADLTRRGIETVEEIPSGYPLTAQQERVRQCIVTSEEWTSPHLGDALAEIKTPVHALDFEAVQFALPVYPDTRPWDALPFQFSCHHQHEDGGPLTHSEFLATSHGDPRTELADALLAALGQSGSILVYSSYERRTINALAIAVPERRDALLALQSRLIDLLSIVRTHYCHPEFRGSYSIKDVLPVLAPHLSYEGMEIADGQAAGLAWLEMQRTDDADRRDQLANALRNYCALDSRAMFALLDALLYRVSRR